MGMMMRAAAKAMKSICVMVEMVARVTMTMNK
jgi:hypothetical protein